MAGTPTQPQIRAGRDLDAARLTKTVVRDGRAECATCHRVWAGIRNLSAVAAIHARAYGHRVDMVVSVRVTFAPARRGRA